MGMRAHRARTRSSARRVIALAIVVVSFFFARSASPAAAATPAAVVVVYPLNASGALAASDVGGKFSTIIATHIGESGRLIVRPFTPGTDRERLLVAARAEGADYYVTGFLTPIGDEVSVVCQVVSTTSGTVIWSQSALVKTFGDAGAQADAIERAVLAHEGRYVAALEAPTPSPAETSHANGRANEADIDLTGRRRGRHAAPSPAPAPSPNASPLALATSPPPTPQAVPGVRRTPVAVARAPHPAATAPPPFAHGSGYASLRSSIPSAAGSFAARFAPHGAALTSVTGLDDPAARAAAIAALVPALHAHGVTSAAWNVGVVPVDFVRRSATRFCLAHGGIGILYAAEFVRRETAGGSEVDLRLTRSDCGGTLRDSATASAVATSAAAAARASVVTAASRLKVGP